MAMYFYVARNEIKIRRFVIRRLTEKAILLSIDNGECTNRTLTTSGLTNANRFYYIYLAIVYF